MQHRTSCPNVTIKCQYRTSCPNIRLNNVPQIILNAKDRKSGRNIPRTVWIVHKGNILYLLPNYGSGTVVIELPRKSSVENLGRWGRNACKRKPVADNESCRHFE